MRYAPQQSRCAPERSCHAPEQSRRAPQQSCHAPEQSRRAPQQSCRAPEQSCHAPQQSCHAPEQSRRAPQRSRRAPQRSCRAHTKMCRAIAEIITANPQRMQRAPRIPRYTVGSRAAPARIHAAPRTSMPAPRRRRIALSSPGIIVGGSRAAPTDRCGSLSAWVGMAHHCGRLTSRPYSWRVIICSCRKSSHGILCSRDLPISEILSIWRHDWIPPDSYEFLTFQTAVRIIQSKDAHGDAANRCEWLNTASVNCKMIGPTI